MKATLMHDGAFELAERLLEEGKPVSGFAVFKTATCDVCRNGSPAAVDCKTQMGQWGDLCLPHFRRYGIGLGTGLGQVLLEKK